MTLWIAHERDTRRRMYRIDKGVYRRTGAAGAEVEV
jgi:hypothetical protein